MKKPLSYYESYRTIRRIRSIKQRQLELIDDKSSQLAVALSAEIRDCDIRMGEIETDIRSYVPESATGKTFLTLNDERMFLELRCLGGLTIENIAEAMCVSRDTAYRIRRRIASGI